MTEPGLDDALPLLQCERIMTELVESIQKAYGSPLDAESRAKISRYLETLTSAGKQDFQQLQAFGLAYLEQLHNPDPRYSGC